MLYLIQLSSLSFLGLILGLNKLKHFKYFYDNFFQISYNKLLSCYLQVYRLHQLNRAAQLVTALSFTVRGAELTSHNMAINSSLGTLLNVLQFLGVICIWSLSSFLMRFIPSTSNPMQWSPEFLVKFVNSVILHIKAPRTSSLGRFCTCSWDIFWCKLLTLIGHLLIFWLA